MKVYKGTQRYKARIWMHSYWNWNWGPCMRAEFNKVEYACRTAGIVRGPRPYALIVDDIKKDGDIHVYDWQMHLPTGITTASWWKMPAGLTVLAREDDMGKRGPNAGAPCLAALVLQRERATRDLADITIRKKLTTRTGSLVITARAVEPEFKIALVPFRFGGPIPEVIRDADPSTVAVAWKQGKGDAATVLQQDVLRFTKADDSRTRLTIARNGETILNVE